MGEEQQLGRCEGLVGDDRLMVLELLRKDGEGCGVEGRYVEDRDHGQGVGQAREHHRQE